MPAEARTGIQEQAPEPLLLGLTELLQELPTSGGAQRAGEDLPTGILHVCSCHRDALL